MSFKKTSREHSYRINDSNNRKHDSCNHEAEDQRKEDIISYAKFLEILKGVLHKQEADSLQQQHNANQKA